MQRQTFTPAEEEVGEDLAGIDDAIAVLRNIRLSAAPSNPDKKILLSALVILSEQVNLLKKSIGNNAVLRIKIISIMNEMRKNCKIILEFGRVLTKQKSHHAEQWNTMALIIYSFCSKVDNLAIATKNLAA